MASILESVVKHGKIDLEGVLIRSIMRPINSLKSRVDTLALKLEEVSARAQQIPLQGIAGIDGKDGLNGKDGKDGLQGKDGQEGREGKQGKEGLKGVDGTNGIDGISVVSAEVTFDNHLVLTLSNGNEIDAGLINVENKTNYVTQIKGEDVVSYSTRYDQVSTTLAYKGEAIIGASEASPLWRIQKLVYGTDGDVTITWATGTTDFRFVWDDRATLTYI